VRLLPRQFLASALLALTACAPVETHAAVAEPQAAAAPSGDAEETAMPEMLQAISKAMAEESRNQPSYQDGDAEGLIAEFRSPDPGEKWNAVHAVARLAERSPRVRRLLEAGSWR
jgi:hypothetical protein